jgi:hypothetical protein
MLRLLLSLVLVVAVAVQATSQAQQPTGTASVSCSPTTVRGNGPNGATNPITCQVSGSVSSGAGSTAASCEGLPAFARCRLELEPGSSSCYTQAEGSTSYMVSGPVELVNAPPESDGQSYPFRIVARTHAASYGGPGEGCFGEQPPLATSSPVEMTLEVGEQPSQAREGRIDLRIHTPGDNAQVDSDAEDQAGGYLFTNIDDDDDDAHFDLDPADLDVPGEDDLVRVEVWASCEACDPAGRVLLTPSPGVRLWTERTKMAPSAAPLELGGVVGADLKLLGTVWAEGIQGSQSPGDVSLTAESLDFSALADSAKLTVLRVAGVEIAGRDNGLRDDAALDREPNFLEVDGVPNLRVFPDARFEEKTGAIGSERAIVDVTMRLNLPPPLRAVDIFARPFDVDDPSSAAAPVDDETIDEDNREPVVARRAGELAGATAANPIATVTFPVGTDARTLAFTVPGQPGDNVRIAAAHDDDALRQLRNSDSTDSVHLFDASVGTRLPDEGARVSPILTTWRILNVESDTMAGPRRGFRADRDGDRLDPDDDPGVLPTQPDTSRLFHYLTSGFDPALSPVFAPAYVLPRTTSLARFDRNDGVTFEVHTEDPEAEASGLDAPCRERNDQQLLGLNRPEFWAVYVLSVFKGGPAADNDPDDLLWELGYTPRRLGFDKNCTIIYQENVRDLAAFLGRPFGLRQPSRAVLERATVVHEVGHSLGAEHPAGTLATTHADRDIMDAGWPITFVDVAPPGWTGETLTPRGIPNRFGPTNLMRIRALVQPGR